jgi:hypothetical protein
VRTRNERLQQRALWPHLKGARTLLHHGLLSAVADTLHAVAHDPPQSTPSSLPFRTPSPQVTTAPGRNTHDFDIPWLTSTYSGAQVLQVPPKYPEKQLQ